MTRSRRTFCLILLVAALVSQAVSQQKPARDNDQPGGRAAWFAKGRQSPDAQPAAAHLLHAVRQAVRLAVARPTATSSFSAAPATTGGVWTELGPRPQFDGTYGNVSGRITSLAVDLTSDPTGNTVYLGAAYGGVWKSVNALSSSPVYTAISDPAQSLAVGALAVDGTTSPATLYVGTGESNVSQDSYYGVGILKSTDGGASWTLASSADSGSHPFAGGSFSRILIDPNNHNTVLAGFTGASHAQGLAQPVYGVYLSMDGGATWALTLHVTDGSNPNGCGVTDLAYDAQNRVYYAALRGRGIYKSTDGSNWVATNSPFAGAVAPDDNNFDRASLAARNGVVYALITSNTGDFSEPSGGDTGIVQSADGGQTWTPIANPNDSSFFGSDLQGWYDQAIAAPAGTTALVIAGIDIWTTANVSGSSTTWTNTTNAYNGGSVHPDEHAIAVASATTWFIGNDGGLWHTTDGGNSWTNDNATLGNIQFISVSANPTLSSHYFGGSQDNGTARGSSTSSAWDTIWDGDGGYTDTNPNNPSQYFTENFDISLERSDNSGNGFQVVVDSGTIADSSAFYPPFEVIPERTSEVILGTCRVWMGPGAPASTGAGWAPISPDLSTGHAGNSCSYSGNILGLASAPSDANVIYAVTDDGVVQRTTNALASSPTWTDLTVSSLPGGHFLPFSSVAVDPADANTAYVGVMGFGYGHVFKTTDGGQSWLDVTGNLPDAPVNSIVVDPENPADVYVGSDVGVFVATDGGVSGETWQRMGAGLPDTTVLQLKLSTGGTRVLLAATHGRGAWAIAPLTNTPDFFVSVTPDHQTLTSGQDGSAQVTVNAINGYTGTVTLSCTAPAAGCSVSPASLTPGQSATLTVLATAITAPDTAVTISASGGGLSHSDTVLMSNDFTLSLQPSTVSVLTTQTASLQVTGMNAGTTETLSCSGVPSGVTCSFAPASLSATVTQSTLTISAANSTAAGSSTPTVEASDGSNVVSAPFKLQVSTFAMTATQSTAVAYGAAGTASYTISASSPAGSSASIALACGGLPAGASCSFSPATITPGQVSTLTVSNPGSGQNGMLNFAVTGTAGAESETLPLTLTVEDFTLTAASSTDYASGDTASYTLATTAVNGLTQPIALACGTLPTGLACSFSPASVTPGQSATLTVSGISKLGSLPVTFNAQGTVGGDTHSVALTVAPAQFTLTPASATVAIVRGAASAGFSFSSTASGGFSGTLSFSCSGLPAGVSCAFSPATVTAGGATGLTVSGLGTQPAGNLTFNAVASSGAESQSVPLTLSIGDFSLSTPASNDNVVAGADTASFTVTSAAINGFSSPITLSCGGLPAGVSCAFSPASISPGQSSALTVSGLNQLNGQSLSFNANGASGPDSQTMQLSLTVENFTLSAPIDTASILAGTDTASLSVTATAVNGFNAPLTLACGGLPAGVSCAFNPASINPGQTAAVTVSGLGSQPGGPVKFNLIASNGALLHTVSVTVQIEDFSVAAASSSATASGDTATFALTTTALGGFTQPMTLACSGLPTGAACSFSPAAPAPGRTATLTVSGLSGLVSPTPISFSMQATAGGLSHSLPLTIQFSDFTISAGASTVAIARGTGSAAFTLNTTAIGGFKGAIAVTCSGLPAGAACSAASITADQSAALNVTGLASQPAGNIAFTATASSGTLSHSLPLTVAVGDFSLTAPATSTTVNAGTDTTTYTVNTAAINGFTGAIALACGGLPQGAACSFSPASVTPGQSSTLTLSGLNAAAANFNDTLKFSVTGTSGADSQSLALSASIADVASPATGGSPSQTVTAGQTASYSLTYSSANGFTGNVMMSCSGAPSQASCSVNPASFTLSAGGTQKVTVSVATTALATPLGEGGRRQPLLPLATLAAALLALAGWTGRRARAVRWALAPMVVMLAALLLAGCGGGGGAPATSTAPAPAGTPHTTSQISVTATVNGVAHTTQLTLTVQ